MWGKDAPVLASLPLQVRSLAGLAGDSLASRAAIGEQAFVAPLLGPSWAGWSSLGSECGSVSVAD